MMKYSINSQKPSKQTADCLIIPIFSDHRTTILKTLDKPTQNLIAKLIKQGKISAESGHCDTLIHTQPSIMLIGMGKQSSLTAEKLTALSQTLSKELKSLESKRASLFISELVTSTLELPTIIERLLQHCDAAFYSYHHYKTQKSKAPKLGELCLVVEADHEKAAKEQLKTTKALLAGINLTKDLVNGPCNLVTPRELANQAELLAAAYKTIKCEILDTKAMTKLKMNALLAVGQGSEEPSYLVTVEYKGAAASKKPIVLVGKGVTFDTGGISLKPGAGMEDMKTDMSGAATVLGVIRAIAEQGLPINVVGVIPTVVNMPDGKSYKPGDVLTSMSGQTIEIVNTDAEGRVILCDALTYAKRYNPEVIIDIATLTGAVIVALGEIYQGVFTHHDSLREAILTAAKETGDKTWAMPLDADYQRLIDSRIADMKNSGGRYGGSITAACFLERFVDKKQAWAHLDIAGTACHLGDSHGATGRPVPLLVQYLKNTLR